MSTKLPSNEELKIFLHQIQNKLSTSELETLTRIIEFIVFYRELLLNPPPCSSFSVEYLLKLSHILNFNDLELKKIGLIHDAIPIQDDEQKEIINALLNFNNVIKTHGNVIAGPFVENLRQLYQYSTQISQISDIITAENLDLKKKNQELMQINEQLVKNEQASEKQITELLKQIKIYQGMDQ